MYPLIRFFSDLEPHIRERNEILVREEVCADRVLISVSCTEPHDDTFDCEWRRECNGILFDKKTGALISRTFHKFHAIGETKETSLEEIKKLSINFAVEKINGTQVTPVMINNRIYCRDKTGFDTYAAQGATSFFQGNSEQTKRYYNLVKDLRVEKKTPIFEYKDPAIKKIVTATKPELVLTGVRDNESGHYWSYDSLCSLSRRYGVSIPPKMSVARLAEFIIRTRKLINTEGCVIHFNNGLWAILRTEWYSSLQNGLTLYRHRDIARICLNNAFDYYKSLITEAVIQERVSFVENEFREKYRNFVEPYIVLSKEMKKLSELNAWQLYRNDPHFNIASRLLKGEEIDFRELYKKHRLTSDFNLDKIA